MMRRQLCLYLMALLFPMALLSQPSLAQPDLEETTHSEPVVLSAIPEGRVRVTITKPRPRIQVAKIHQPVARLLFEEDDTDYYDELPDLQVGYRRPELFNQTADIDLSDEIKIRLLLARKRALEAHQAKWG